VTLGVELGLSIATIEEIRLNNAKSYFDQNRGVMEEWTRSSKVRPIKYVLQWYPSLTIIRNGDTCIYLSESFIKKQGR
jgi:hypothetical protein